MNPLPAYLNIDTLEVGRSCEGDLYLYTPEGDPVARISEEIGGHPIENARQIADKLADVWNACREIEQGAHAAHADQQRYSERLDAHARRGI